MRGDDGYQVSRDCRHVAYAIRQDGKCLVVLDGQPVSTGEEILTFVLSPDGKRVADIAMKGDKKVVVVDGQPGLCYNDIEEHSLNFSPDGKHVAYEACQGDNQFVVVVDGKPGPSIIKGIGKSRDARKFIDRIIFSLDGKRVAYRSFGVRRC